MGSRKPYCYCFVGRCFQDLFIIACNILVQFMSRFFSICIVSAHVVHLYSSVDKTAAWKTLCFTSSDRPDYLWPIVNQCLTIPSLVAYSCHFPLMRSCFRGRWIRPLVSGNTFYCEYISSLILIKVHVIWFSSIDMKLCATSCHLQTIQSEFGLGGYICQKRYVISVVGVCHNLSGAFFCFLTLSVWSHFLSLNLPTFEGHRLIMNMEGASVSPCRTTATMS